MSIRHKALCILQKDSLSSFQAWPVECFPSKILQLDPKAQIYVFGRKIRSSSLSLLQISERIAVQLVRMIKVSGADVMDQTTIPMESQWSAIFSFDISCF